MKSLSRVQLFATPWTIAYQAPPSMGFSRQECWSGLPFPSPGDLPNPGIEPGSPALQADAFRLSHQIISPEVPQLERNCSKIRHCSQVLKRPKGPRGLQSTRKKARYAFPCNGYNVFYVFPHSYKEIAESLALIPQCYKGYYKPRNKCDN